MGLNIPPSDTNIFLSDIVTANATTVRHGFLKKLSGVATEFMDGAGNFSTPAGGTATSGSAYAIVGGSASATTNGTNLLAAYAAAKLSTPQGAALSQANRYTIFLLPGIYDLVAASLTLDTKFIDIIGISVNVGQVDTGSSDTIITSSGNTVNITEATTHDLCIANLALRTTSAGTDSAITTSSVGFLASLLVKNVSLSVGGASTRVTPWDKSFNGTWIDVFTAGGNRSFGSSVASAVTLNGTFIRCRSTGTLAFGGEVNVSMTLSGLFIDCVAAATSFGGNNAATTLSGVFQRCGNFGAGSSGAMFGGALGTLSGTFEECSASDGDTSWGAVMSGTMKGCYRGTVAWTSVTGTVTDCSFTGWNGIYAMNVADSAAVANTVAETNFSVTKTIAIKDWRIAKAFRWEAWGKFSTDVATPGTLTIRSKFGATVLRTSGALTLLGGATNAGWMASGIFVLRTAGATGTVSTQLKIELDDSGFIGDSIVPSNGTVTINTTIANTFQLSAEWSVADTDNTITLENFVVVPEAGN